MSQIKNNKVVSRVQSLQKEIERLEGIVGDHSSVMSYLNKCECDREKTFAFTNQQTPEQKFPATVKVDGKEIKIVIEESTLKNILDNHKVLDKLYEARTRMRNIKEFLDEGK